MSNRTCEFSPCRRYRYTLWREWSIEELPFGDCSAETNAHRYLMVIGLNPSTADEDKDDPTIRRCIGFAKRWGFGALCMTNLFAWRDTKPENMKKVVDPVGVGNQHYILTCASNAGMVLCAWGANGSHRNQDLNVMRWLMDTNVSPFCLRVNAADGSPAHPLYIPSDTVPIPYSEAKYLSTNQAFNAMRKEQAK